MSNVVLSAQTMSSVWKLGWRVAAKADGYTVLVAPGA